MQRRWTQLFLGVVAMAAVANLQYGWTLFVDPLRDQFHWKRTAIQLAFTLFVLAETWLVPFEAYLVDLYGPQRMVMIGGALAGLGWVINAGASSLGALYTGQIIAGIGAGVVYGAAVGNALKWFPDRRGLCVGVTAAAFGAGSALTVWPMARMLQHHGPAVTFFIFGLLQAIAVLAAGVGMRAPAAGETAHVETPRVPQAALDSTPAQMLRTPVFWLMYVMFTLAATGGLMAVAQIAPMADDFKVAKVPVSLLGITMAALPFAMSLDRILNGVTRPFFGWVSDHLGRERTMFIALGFEGIAILALIQLAHVPVLFVLLTGLTFFGWGEIYSLFPSLCGDLFGRRFASTNYGLLYTAKGTAALLVPLGAWLHSVTGSWRPIFLTAVAFDWIAALLALFVLAPLARRWLSHRQVELPLEMGVAAAPGP